MRTFTAEELARFNGAGGSPPYVAYAGQVYDLSKSFTWRAGRHHAEHMAGTDLTAAISGAPHGVSLLGRFPVVGRLLDEADQEPHDH